MRARNIKPGFFINDDLGQLDIAARMLFIGLWCAADREGRLEDRPLRIKAQIFPYDDLDIDKLLNDLHESGHINRYEVSGVRYIAVENFQKHQRPHSNEKESEIPAPESGNLDHTPSDGAHDQDQEEQTFDQGEQHLLPRKEALRPDSLIPDTGLPDPPGGADAPADEPQPDPAPKPRKPNPQWRLLEICTELNGGDPSDAHRSTKQLSKFTSLLKQHEFPDIEGCMRWLAADDFWSKKKIDAFTVEKHIDRFVMAGRPDVTQMRSDWDLYPDFDDPKVRERILG